MFATAVHYPGAFIHFTAFIIYIEDASMNILEFSRSTKFSTHVRNKIVVGNYQVVQLVVNFGTSTMLYVPVVARVDNLSVSYH